MKISKKKFYQLQFDKNRTWQYGICVKYYVIIGKSLSFYSNIKITCLFEIDSPTSKLDHPQLA